MLGWLWCCRTVPWLLRRRRRVLPAGAQHRASGVQLWRPGLQLQLLRCGILSLAAALALALDLTTALTRAGAALAITRAALADATASADAATVTVA